jgi:hypothetical protein
MKRVAIAGLLASFLTAPVVAAQQNAANLKPGIPAVQAPFASLKPAATFKIGGTGDWVLVTDDAVWIAGSKTILRAATRSGDE